MSTGIAAAYLSKFDDTWSTQDAIASVRFVVLDTETMGLNPKRDPIITIGAVAVKTARSCSKTHWNSCCGFPTTERR